MLNSFTVIKRLIITCTFQPCKVHLKSDLPFQVNPYLSHHCANHYSTRLVKVSTETKQGKQHCCDIFQWLFKCILKQSRPFLEPINDQPLIFSCRRGLTTIWKYQ